VTNQSWDEFTEKIWWYTARSGGIVAWVLVTLAVCWGLFLSTRAASKATQPAAILDLHRFLGGLSAAFTAVHVVGLVGDTWIQFGWMEVLVPWTSEFKPTAVAWGVIAMYLLVAVELTSLMIKKLPHPLWWQIHRASFGLYIFATIHGIQAGSDTTQRVVPHGHDCVYKHRRFPHGPGNRDPQEGCCRQRREGSRLIWVLADTNPDLGSFRWASKRRGPHERSLTGRWLVAGIGHQVVPTRVGSRSARPTESLTPSTSTGGR
jgi:hypothetical protein